MKPILFKTPESCCGCRACSNNCPKNAISFKADRFGFLFPVIDENLCVGCGRCESVCAFQNNEKKYGRTPIKGYAAVLKDKKRIKQSASGGVFWSVAEWVIGKGGCVFGVVWDSEMNPVHTCAETIEQLEPMQGSKYVQSDIGDTYKKVETELSKKRWVLFTGTPCQVAALRRFLGDKSIERLIAIDIVCHGVPNNVFFHGMLTSLEKQYNGRVVDFHFRHKRPDWLHGCLWVKIQKGKKTITKDIFNIETPYFIMFNKKNQCCRQSCAVCKYATSQRVGDMTMGDFWGYGKVDINLKYKEGLSCLLVNNEKMIPVLNELNIEIQEVPIDSIIAGNGQLRHPYYKDEKWEEVMDSFATDGYEKLELNYTRSNEKVLKKARIQKILPPKLLIAHKSLSSKLKRALGKIRKRVMDY